MVLQWPMRIRLPAEARCADELAALRAVDRWPRPPGWELSPRMVETFIMGNEPGTAGNNDAPERGWTADQHLT